MSAGRALDLRTEAYGELRRTDAAIALRAARVTDCSLAEAAECVAELRRRTDEDGYLYVPGFFDRAQIVGVRDDMVRRLARAGALAPGATAEDVTASATAARVTRADILGATDETGASPIPSVVFSPRLLGFYGALLGGAVRHYDHIWLRLVRPGRGTPPHCDLPYMGRGTREVMTAWIPYRDTSLKLGGLMILERSHLQAHRIRAYLDRDVEEFCVNRGPYKHKPGLLSNNPYTLRERFGGRWLTSPEFRAGDLLTFGMSLIHASLDNQCTGYRLSTDTRYQLASEPIDERWVGPNTEEWAERNRVGKIC